MPRVILHEHSNATNKNVINALCEDIMSTICGQWKLLILRIKKIWYYQWHSLYLQFILSV
jgi:hypothetical protein